MSSKAKKASSGQRRFVCVTNIPTPYRLHLFKHLYKELADRGISFEVLFMATTEPGRFWRFSPDDFEFPYRIVSGVHPYVRGMTLHFNPEILASILIHPPDWLLVGGSWNMPTTFPLPFLTCLSRKRSITILWAEGNLQASRHPSGIVGQFRRKVFESYNAFAVPGKIAAEYVSHFCSSIGKKHLIRLPNVVEDTTFRDSVDAARKNRPILRHQFGLESNEIVVLCPARLHYKKGIFSFLQAIIDLKNHHFHILIAGEGPCRKRIRQWLEKTSFDRVQLLGNQDQAKMVQLYALSDVLLLPSLGDSNPLVVVEALWAALPLLLSERIGNWPEAVIPGENGWIFDPYNPDEVHAAVEQVLKLSCVELSRRGGLSREIAKKHFDTTKVVKQFVDSIFEIAISS